jgi:hypothetical protein
MVIKYFCSFPVNDENLNDILLLFGPSSISGCLFSLMEVMCVYCIFVCLFQLMDVVLLHSRSDVSRVLPFISHAMNAVSCATNAGRALSRCELPGGS